MAIMSTYPAVVTPAVTDTFVGVQGGRTLSYTMANITSVLDTDLQGQITANDAEILALQTDRVLVAGDTMTGALTLFGAPVNVLHATTKNYVDVADALRLLLAGGTMAGDIAMGTNSITGLADPVNAQDGVTRNYIDITSLKVIQDYDVSLTGAYPVTYGAALGPIPNGAVYRVSVAGAILVGGVTHTFEIGDLMIALQALALNNHAHWARLNTNVVTATTLVEGTTRLSTVAEGIAKTLATVALTPACLATGNYQATTVFEGLTETATDAEYLTATAINRSITPSNLAAEITSCEQFVGIDKIIMTTLGTWTTTQIASGDYVSRKTANAEQPIIAVDISQAIRVAANRGVKLNSIDYIWRNITADLLVTHTGRLYQTIYTDGAVVNPTLIPTTITNFLLTQNANPRIGTITIDTPVFLADSTASYIVEIEFQAAAASVYDFIGLNLNWSKTTI